MRDKLIEEVIRLERETRLESFEDFRTWSNADLLKRYGDLRIEEVYMMEEANDDQE